MAILFASCSLEKRVYRNGYYLNTKHGPHKTEDRTVRDLPVAIPFTEEKTPQTDSVCKEEVNPLSKENVEGNYTQTENVVLKHDKNVQPADTSSIKRGRQDPKAGTDEMFADKKSATGGGGALLIIGWLLIGLGIVLLLFISILVGILLMLLGLVFIIVGRKGGKGPKISTNDSSEYVDVVYLKNGSVVRGVIIEQVPGVSLKIQTSDGSVFFYKMDEIEKITKEKSNK